MNRRLLIVVGLFLVLGVVLIAVPPAQGSQPPLTAYSAEPGGGKALRLWLEALGYPVTTLEGSRFTIGQDVGVVLLLSPTQPIGFQAIGELERWVRQGGRLIVAEDGFLAWVLLRRFDVTTLPVTGVTRALPAEPGLLDPAIGSLSVETPFELILGERADGAVPLLVGERPTESSARPVLAARVPVERGEVIVLTTPELFSNAGLRTEANARLALSLIGPLGPDGRNGVAFDEIHHGFGQAQDRSLYALLFEQAWGRTAILAGVVLLLFLLWHGRRFGRSVPIFVDRGRALGELVTSQASLYRVGRKRQFVADHLSRQLRQEIAQAVGLPADAPDAEIAARAATVGRDPAPALRVLNAVQHARTDRELLAIARDGERARRELALGSQVRAQ